MDVSPLDGMTYDRWRRLPYVEQERLRDPAALHPVLRQYVGWRVEVDYYGERKRFIIGQSMGWQPVTLGLHNRRSIDSSHTLSADNCTLIRPIERIR